MAVIKNTTIYLGVSILQSFMSFLLLPVYTFFLDKAEFGLASVLNSVAALLGILFVFGTQSVISRLYFDYKDDSEKLKRFLGTIFLSKFIWNIFLASVLLLGRDIIFPFIAEDVNFYPYLLIALSIGFFNTIFIIYQTLQQTKQEGFKYAILQIVYLIINNGITVILLAVFDMKAEGVVLGTLIADVLMTLFVLYRLKNQIRLVIDKEILSKAMAFSWPILFQALFTWSLASVNKLILNNTLSVEIVGVYNIGFVIAGIVNMTTVALNRSYMPWFFGQMKKEREVNGDIVQFTEFTILVYSVIAFGLSILSPALVKIIVGDAYQDAWQIIPFLAFGYVFNGLYFFFYSIFNYKLNAVKFIPLYSLLAAVLNISLNYLLIPRFGMIGSAVATMLSMIVLSITSYYGSKRFLNLGYRYIKLFTLILLTFVLSLFVFVDLGLSFWYMQGIRFVYMLFCLLVIYLLNRQMVNRGLEKQVGNIKRYILKKL